MEEELDRNTGFVRLRPIFVFLVAMDSLTVANGLTVVVVVVVDVVILVDVSVVIAKRQVFADEESISRNNRRGEKNREEENEEKRLSLGKLIFFLSASKSKGNSHGFAVARETIFSLGRTHFLLSLPLLPLLLLLDAKKHLDACRGDSKEGSVGEVSDSGRPQVTVEESEKMSFEESFRGSVEESQEGSFEESKGGSVEGSQGGSVE